MVYTIKICCCCCVSRSAVWTRRVCCRGRTQPQRKCLSLLLLTVHHIIRQHHITHHAIMLNVSPQSPQLEITAEVYLVHLSLFRWLSGTILPCCAPVHTGQQCPGSNLGHIEIFGCVCCKINFSDEYRISKYLPYFSLYLMLIVRAYVVSVCIN